MLIRLYDPVGIGSIHMIFASNDGGGGGGLSGVVGFIPGPLPNVAATGSYTHPFTYGDILGACTSCWHKYEIRWNKDGLPGVANGQARGAVFLDDVLNSNYFLINPPSSVFPTFQGGQLDLGYDNTQVTPDTGIVTFDELKIFDGQGNLVLYNTLDSVYAVEPSALGLNGTYLAGSFVPSPFGHALTQAVCDGAATGLSALITSKSGPQNARLWTLALTNNN